MAGNTISIPVVGSILAVMLAATTLRRDGDQCVGEIGSTSTLRSSSSTPQVVWIGDHRASAEGANEWNCILRETKNTDASNPSKKRKTKRTTKGQRKVDEYFQRPTAK